MRILVMLAVAPATMQELVDKYPEYIAAIQAAAIGAAVVSFGFVLFAVVMRYTEQAGPRSHRSDDSEDDEYGR